MCGICGQIRFDGSKVKKNLLTAMLTKLEKRGPDFGDIVIDNDIGLGHRRLAVIDLSKRGNQPMIDEKLGLTLVFNGTIYNYQALRRQLINKGYQFNSHSDSETILKAYAHWGYDCVHHLDGMFAFAVWDKSKQQLFLARDRMGIKPLYFSSNSTAFSFASTLQALLLTGSNTTINTIALENQLLLHGVVPAPRTIINGVNKLRPGHYKTININGKTSDKQYWYPQAQIDKNVGEQDHLDKTHKLLKSATQKRMLASDVPIGVLLSGGLDSSLLVAILTELNQKDIRTFSIGFDDIDDEHGNEFYYSDQVVQKFNTKHEKITISNKEVFNRLPNAIGAMSEPMVAQDAVAFYILSEQVAKSVKVVISGQGADEAFGGYFWYPKMQRDFDKSADATISFTKNYFDRPYTEYLATVNQDYHNDNQTKKWINKQLNNPGASEFLNKVLRMDVTRLVVDDPLKRVDNMTMAWGLEARVPFMDTAVVEHALSIPPSIKLRENGKYPLKYIARKLLPNEIIDRKKGYFPMPALKYIKGDFFNFTADILNSSACINRGLYKRDYVQKVLKTPSNYMTTLNGSRLWHLALLEFWLQTHIN